MQTPMNQILVIQVCYLQAFGEDVKNWMIYQKYILTTYRLLTGKWWLSLIKLTSLTIGVISFLLVWLFYIDQQWMAGTGVGMGQTYSTENLLILASIMIITITVYLLIMKSQLSLRYKELFIRKLYGEHKSGVIYIVLIETIIFVFISFVVALVMIDQLAPVFNSFTGRQITVRQFDSLYGFWLLVGFFLFLAIITGLFPALRCAKKRAVDLLRMLPE
jgi:ABC-type antimicrobial peptide transport system permease subunit